MFHLYFIARSSVATASLAQGGSTWKKLIKNLSIKLVRVNWSLKVSAAFPHSLYSQLIKLSGPELLLDSQHTFLLFINSQNCVQQFSWGEAVAQKSLLLPSWVFCLKQTVAQLVCRARLPVLPFFTWFSLLPSSTHMRGWVKQTTKRKKYRWW